MSWYKDLQKRAAEVCEYNDLGFSIIGGHLEEHDRGYKGESREATDREQYMWEKFDYNTPKNPFKEINISELITIETKYGTRLTVPEQYQNEKKIWVREDQCPNIVLYNIEKIGDEYFISEIHWTRTFE